MKKLLADRKRSIPLLIAVVLVVILAVVAIITGITRTHAYALTSTPATTQTPKFAAGAKAVPGWEAVPLDLPANSSVRTAQYQNKKDGCTFTTTTALYPGYLTNRSDAYLSKYALYDQGTQKAVLIKNEATADLFVAGGGKLQFTTGQFSYKNSANANSKAQTFNARVATRAIDKLYKVPATGLGTSDELFGMDGSKGVPVLVAAYTCTDTKGSATEFNALLNAVSVELK